MMKPVPVHEERKRERKIHAHLINWRSVPMLLMTSQKGPLNLLIPVLDGTLIQVSARICDERQNSLAECIFRTVEMGDDGDVVVPVQLKKRRGHALCFGQAISKFE